MKIGVLGTGSVGQTLGTRLVGLGHEVTLGSRSADNEGATAWAAATGAAHGTFADAARGAEIVVNATGGGVSLAALATLDPADLKDTLLLDVSNPLDFSDGSPALSVSGTDSVAEQIQRAYPGALVVKSLNTVTASVMVDPTTVSGEHLVFVSGESEEAKLRVAELLKSFGWRDSQIADLGGIRSARSVEAYILLWISLYGKVGSADFNISLALPS